MIFSDFLDYLLGFLLPLSKLVEIVQKALILKQKHAEMYHSGIHM